MDLFKLILITSPILVFLDYIKKVIDIILTIDISLKK